MTFFSGWFSVSDLALVHWGLFLYGKHGRFWGVTATTGPWPTNQQTIITLGLVLQYTWKTLGVRKQLGWFLGGFCFEVAGNDIMSQQLSLLKKGKSWSCFWHKTLDPAFGKMVCSNPGRSDSYCWWKKSSYCNQLRLAVSAGYLPGFIRDGVATAF